MAASAAEMIETKSSKPVPKPRVGMRKSAVRGPSCQDPPPPFAAPPTRDLRAGVEPACSPCTSDSWPLKKQPCSLGSSCEVLTWEGSGPPQASCSLPRQVHQGPASRGYRERGQSGSPCDVTLSVCSASHPRCRWPLIVAVVTVTPAPPTVLPTFRCRLLVLESRSLHLLLSVCPSSRSDRELSETLVASPSACMASFFPELPSCHPCLRFSPCSVCPPLSRGLGSRLWACPG